MSHSTRSEWIEILLPDGIQRLMLSHSTRSEWIEIQAIILKELEGVSHSTRSEWIEIWFKSLRAHVAHGLTPHGVSGLKYACTCSGLGGR